VRRPGWWAARRRAASAVIAVGVVVLGAATGNGVASAAPARANAPAAHATFATNLAGPGDVDNRTGTMRPTGTQSTAAARVATKVRWNAFGTPAVLGPGTLATGLSTDPVTAAKDYLSRNTALFGLDAAAIAGLTTVAVSPLGAGSVVLLQQTFGTLPAGNDGLVAVAVTGGKVVRVTSTLSRMTNAPAAATLTADQAVGRALADARIAAGTPSTRSVREVAVPTAQGPRAAYEVTLTAPNPDRPLAYQTYVDGVTGAVLLRQDQVDFDSDNPKWAVFPATPPPANTASGVDTRVIWCQTPAPGCAKAVSDPVTGAAWDVDVATGQPTFTTRGNSANDVLNLGNGTPQTNATPRPDRNYIYPFTDQWHVARCNPATFTSPQRNDADAATANLFAMHNRIHDFAAQLGFTEATWNMQQVNVTGEGLGADPEQGRAQSNALGAAGTTPTRAPGATASRRPRTCSSGSRRPARRTRRASTATTT
jgi:extracellular elastinolytic metalloproteinase